MRTVIGFVVAIGLISAVPAGAQTASQASEASVVAASRLPAASLDLLAAGGEFSVIALRPIGHTVEATLLSAATGVEFSIEVLAATVAETGIVAGSVLTASAVASGHLLLVGDRVIAFVPSEQVATMIHRQELRR